jgi:hypothetical protein
LDPGDSFSTILVKQTLLYDVSGKKIRLSVGDKMEYLSIYKYFNSKLPGSMTIDMRYYIDSLLNSFARFICHREEFQPNINRNNTNTSLLVERNNMMSDEEFEITDRHSVKVAVKYLEHICDEYDGITHNRTQPAIYKQFYKRTNNIANEHITEQLGIAAILLKNDVSSNGMSSNDMSSRAQMEAYYTSLYDELLKYAEDNYNNWGDIILKELFKRDLQIHTIKTLYFNSSYGIINLTVGILKTKFKALEYKMKTQIYKMINIINNEHKKLTHYIMNLRDQYLEEQICDDDRIKETVNMKDDDIHSIHELYKSYNELAGIIIHQTKIKSIKDAITAKLMEKEEFVKPSNGELAKNINNATFEVTSFDKFT